MKSIRFSKRTDWNTEESALARAHRQRVASGHTLLDLTASNPTHCGFDYPKELLAPLADLGSFDYEPIPLGNSAARDAVADYYQDHTNSRVDASRILLTTSTSEAYGFLFKLLCDPGDEVLVPRPSYPLFDFLADVEAVRIRFAPLVYDHGWQLDLEGLRQQITVRTRAVVLVHPNNPTGHFTTLAQAKELAALCREHGLALIVDEVFLDYAFSFQSEAQVQDRPQDRGSFVGRELDVLTFVVSGISKICALPQMKAAWLVACGPGKDEAMSRLEIIADTYLSMNAPVQFALPVWLGQRHVLQDQIRARTLGNLAELDRQLAMPPGDEALVNRLELQGGWYAVLRIPALHPDEVTTGELLDQGVWVHPGYFFGMADSGWLVVSLLTPPAAFAAGMALLLDYLHSR